MTILGGSNGAGQSGNIRSGYYSGFLPCRCLIIPSEIITKYNLNQPIDYTIKVQVQNKSLEWIELPEAGYVQINRNPEGDTESTSITIQDAVKWSIYNDTYSEILKPSKRLIRILASIDGTSFSPIFTGKISNYQQPEGANGGAINLTCRDVRAILKIEDAISFTASQTAFHNVKKQVQTTLRSANLSFSGQFADSSGTILVQGNKITAVDTSVPNRKWYNTSNGNIIIDSGLAESLETSGELITFSDDNIFQATRSFSDDSVFNSVRITGLDSAGETTTETVQDDNDVSERGSIFYSGGIVGGASDSITLSRTIAQQMIETSLQGKFSLQVIFCPFFELGQIVKVQSDRFNIPESYAKITRVRHQYQVGNDMTFLDDLQILSEV